MMWARDCCLMLLSVAVALAAAFAWAKTGKRIAARIAMIAMTTSSSMSVKPARFLNMFRTPTLRQHGIQSNANRLCLWDRSENGKSSNHPYDYRGVVRLLDVRLRMVCANAITESALKPLSSRMIG